MMRNVIKFAALEYAADELGRDIDVVDCIDHGTEALVLCKSNDDQEDFALHIVASVYGWRVVNECGVEDFARNKNTH